MQTSRPSTADLAEQIADLVRRPSGAGTPRLSEIAERLHYSEEHLSRVFRAQTGMRLRDFVTALHVERGVADLVAGGSVDRSRWKAGHASTSTYIHSFRKLTGMSPGAFQRTIPRLVDAIEDFAANPGGRSLVHRARGCEPVAQAHSLTVRVHDAMPRSILFLALHPGPLTRVEPFLGVAMVGTDSVVIDAVPDGEYVVMVVEVPLDRGVRPLFHLDANRRDIRRRPVRFPLGADETVDLHLRPLLPTDPPITPNLPHLVRAALDREWGAAAQEVNSRQPPRPNPA